MTAAYMEYADHHITPRPMPLIEAVPVVRDGEYGYWFHPDMPYFDEGDGDRFKAWLCEQLLELRFVMLEDNDSPQAAAYWDGGDPDLTFWEPQPPAGEGWFLLWLSDTEDGGCAAFSRRTTRYPAELVESDGGEA